MNENKSTAIIGYFGLAMVIGVTFFQAMTIDGYKLDLVQQVAFVVSVLTLLFISVWHEIKYRKEKVKN